jgi:hypothetical protein
LQLRHSFPLGEMYGENYGYRSGLNRSMVTHLQNKVGEIISRYAPAAGEIVLDIGSNDSTLLRAYPTNLTLVGMDPTGVKFQQYYPEHVRLIPDFFSAAAFQRHCPGQKAKIVTSIAMFYDLEDPVDFMRQVQSILAVDGVWVLEQSYMPLMIERNAYDTVCHEHLEYYGLRQLKWLAAKAGLKIISVELNDTNGGSFSVTTAREDSPYKPDQAVIDRLIAQEVASGYAGLAPYQRFSQAVAGHKQGLQELITALLKEKKTIYGYGASTKGNVILQYCGLTTREIPYIAEVNTDKYGCFTPGTGIPIIAEAEARTRKPDYFLVLPWHFRENIIQREADYLAKGGKMIFPLPRIEVFP